MCTHIANDVRAFIKDNPNSFTFEEKLDFKLKLPEYFKVIDKAN